MAAKAQPGYEVVETEDAEEAETPYGECARAACIRKLRMPLLRADRQPRRCCPPPPLDAHHCTTCFSPRCPARHSY